MIDSQIKSLIKQREPVFKRVERNLFIRVSKELTAFWVFQIKQNGKDRRMIFGKYGSKVDEISLADARIKVAEFRVQFKKSGGVEPFSKNPDAVGYSFKTFDDLARDWIKDECSALKYPQIPARIYEKEIKPYIGNKPIDLISGFDVRDVINKVKESGRPSIANDTLYSLKQIFSHGIRLGVTNSNPAAAFKNKQAGGTEISRERYLSYDEVETVFKILREQRQHFTSENYIALVLLLLLGVRKTELIQAKWEEFDLKLATWNLPAKRTKTDSFISIALPYQVLPLFNYLKLLAQGSEFVFPTRRSGTKGHISNDTLNHAVANLFGKRTGKNKSSTGNVFGVAGIQHFVIHDLRRSCRTFLEQLKISSRVAEKCLNHKVKGVEAIYAKHDYFVERKEALQILTDHLYPLLSDPRLTI